MLMFQHGTQNKHKNLRIFNPVFRYAWGEKDVINIQHRHIKLLGICVKTLQKQQVLLKYIQ